MTKNRKKKQYTREYAAASGLTYNQARNELGVTRPVTPGLSKLNFTPETLAAIKRLLDRPHGILVLAGPMGSGKTTTAAAIAAYDPRVAVVDEVRDQATAQAMFDAVEAGKKVVATVHADSAVAGMLRIEHLAGEAADDQSRWGHFTGTISIRLVRDQNGRTVPAAGTDNRFTGEYRELAEDLDYFANAKCTRGTSLDGLGFTDATLDSIRAAIAQPAGIMVIAGPTFSGKSTLLTEAAAERADAAIFDDIEDTEGLTRALAEAATGRKVIITMHATGPVDAKHTLAQLVSPPGDPSALAAIRTIVSIQLVKTTDSRLRPVVSVYPTGGEPRGALHDLNELVSTGAIDRDSVSIRRFFRARTREN